MKGVAAIAVAATLTLSAQDARFRTGVDAVRVDALVVDGRRPVVGLIADDFELRDSGVVQRIDSIALADVPVSVMLVLDVSFSVSGRTLDRLKEGVGAALAALTPSDRAALITFSSDVRLRADWSGDIVPITGVLQTLGGAGGTSLADGVFAALTFGDPTPTVRRLVLVFSDGADTASWLPPSAVIDKARRTESVVYAVTMHSSPMFNRTGRPLLYRSGIELLPGDRPARTESPFLDEMADVTGGASYRTESADELRSAFTKILTEFRTRYLITYTPRGVDRAGWHPLDVTLKAKKGRVTARRGYLR
jgi:Ca-activated chloride channel homolog